MKKIVAIIAGLAVCMLAFSQNNVEADSAYTQSRVNEFANLNASVLTKGLADSLYAAKRYRDAIGVYENLLQTKGVAADVYYNLGNAYYRIGEIPLAILNYERCLSLSPSNGDARFNLDVAYSKTVDKESDMPESTFYGAWFKSLRNLMDSDGWAVLGLVAFVLLLVSLLFIFMSRRAAMKMPASYLSGVFFILALLGNIMAASQKSAAQKKDKAIIMQPTVTVRSTPSASGTELFVLHGGHKVRITDGAMKNWVEIEINDTQKGWIPTEALDVI